MFHKIHVEEWVPLVMLDPERHPCFALQPFNVLVMRAMEYWFDSNKDVIKEPINKLPDLGSMNRTTDSLKKCRFSINVCANAFVCIFF